MVRNVVAWLALALLTLTATLGVVVLDAPAARASCVGPSITSPATTVTRGAVIVLTGTAWGTACNDTGLKPGERVLGAPARGITVSVVQGNQTVVLARGDAGRDYSWATRIEIPATMEPGEATLIARATAPAFTAHLALTISSSPPVQGGTGAVSTFVTQPPALAAAAPPDALPASGLNDLIWWAIGAAGLLALAGFGLATRRSRRRAD